MVLGEEQQILKQTAAELVRSKSSFRRLRALRDGSDPARFSRDLWREMAALGWAGILLPEEYGGSHLGYLDLAVVMEELGRGLVPEPMLSTALLGANAVLDGGSAAQKKEMLPAVCAGDLLLTLGATERNSRFEPHHVETGAERNGKDWMLRGEKWLVPDGAAADRIIVSARTSGRTTDGDGITLFVIDRGAKGVTVTPQQLLDGRGAAIVSLEGAPVSESAVLGEVGRGGELLEAVLDRATAALCAEMVGSMLAVFEMTLEYLQTREQFGARIGTFQALKHRAAVVFTEIELARSAALGLAKALDEKSPRTADLVDIAKARCSDAFLLAANEGVQMHGGIGMTDEHDVGFFLKRARAAEMTFGDAAWHRRRYAARHGY